VLHTTCVVARKYPVSRQYLNRNADSLSIGYFDRHFDLRSVYIGCNRSCNLLRVILVEIILVDANYVYAIVFTYAPCESSHRMRSSYRYECFEAFIAATRPQKYIYNEAIFTVTYKIFFILSFLYCPYRPVDWLLLPLFNAYM